MNAIELRRFGRFEGVRVDLPRDARMHVIHGPNEAGKTTLLNAITYTLYGMPTRGTEREPDYGFLHALPTLRTGVELTRDDGSTLHVVRKRGRAGTVVSPTTDAADARAEAALTGVLHGVPKDVWLARHGLSQERLRAGGRALLASDGDAADALFAAATGITVVREVLTDVRGRRQALLADSGRTGDLHAAVKEHDEAKAELRVARGATDGYDDFVARRDEITREREQLVGERATNVARAEQLEAVRAAAGPLDERARLIAERDEIDAPAIAWTREDHAEHAAAMDELADATTRLATLEGRLERERARLAELRFDATLLAAEEQVAALHQRVGAVRAARDAVATLEAELAVAVAIAERAARAAMDAAGVDAATLPAGAVRTELTRLADAGDVVARAHAVATTAADMARTALARHSSALEAIGVVNADTTAALTPLIEAAGAIDHAGHHARVAAADMQLLDLERRARALPGCDFDLEAARMLELPPIAEIEQLAGRFEELDRAAGQQRTLLDQARTHRAARQAKLADIEGEREVADPSELHAVRATRDEAWTIIRTGIERGATAPDSLASASNAVPEFERAHHAADVLADELADDGQRVGEATSVRREIALDEEREITTSRALERIAADRAAMLDGDWTRLWSRSGVSAPANPDAMRAFVADIERLRADAAALDQARIRVAADAATMADITRQLRRALGADPVASGATADATADAPDAQDVTGFVVALDAARTRRDAAAATHTERTERLGAVRTATEQDETARHDLEHADRELATWTTSWARACADAGIDPASTITAARARLTAFDELARAAAAHATAEQSLADVRASIERFTNEVAGLLADLGAAAAHIDAANPELAVSVLQQAVSDAKVTRTQHVDLSRTIDELDAERVREAAARDTADQRMSTVTARAPGTDRATLAALDAAWATRDGFDQRILNLDQQLLESTRLRADELAELRGTMDDAELVASAARLREEAHATDARLALIQTERDELIERLGAAETSSQVAEAQQRMANALARIERLTPEYRSLALQEHMLAEFLELKAQGDMGPVVRLAGEYFARLTCDAFTRLQVEPDEDGTLILTAVRASDGSGVHVQGMSEGTVDQLYLALRLATLVTALEAGTEIMPLIVDDILMTFDDARSAATLALFGDIAAETSMQVLFLTHHERLVEQAREVVDPSTLAVIELGAGAGT